MDHTSPLADSVTSNARGRVPVDVQPFDPPAVDPSHLGLIQKLSRRRTPIAVELAGKALAFTPIGLGSIDTAVPKSERVVFWLQVEGRPLALTMAKSLYQRLLMRLDPELLAADLDDDILPLLLESCLEDGLLAAETALKSRIELMAIREGAALDLAGLDMALELALDGERAGRVSLRGSKADIEHLALLSAARPKPSRFYGDLAIELRFRARSLWLDLGALKALKPGDVLIAEEDDTRWDRMAAVSGEHWLFPVEFTNAGLVAKGPFRRADARDQEDWMMVEQDSPPEDMPIDPLKNGKSANGAAAATEHDTNRPDDGGDLDDEAIETGPASPPADAAFDDLPIKLVFEFGRLELPLGELQEIGAGHVFELTRPIGEAVDIQAGNRRIGQGEIVRIDGQIGVRVVRLFGQTRA